MPTWYISWWLGSAGTQLWKGGAGSSTNCGNNDLRSGGIILISLVMFIGMCLGILQIMMALGPFSRWSVCACKPPRRRARGNRCPPPAFIIPLSTSPSGALDQDLGIATLKDSNESSLRVLSKISGAIYLRVPTLSNKFFFQIHLIIATTHQPSKRTTTLCLGKYRGSYFHPGILLRGQNPQSQPSHHS